MSKKPKAKWDKPDIDFPQCQPVDSSHVKQLIDITGKNEKELQCFIVNLCYLAGEYVYERRWEDESPNEADRRKALLQLQKEISRLSSHLEHVAFAAGGLLHGALQDNLEENPPEFFARIGRDLNILQKAITFASEGNKELPGAGGRPPKQARAYFAYKVLMSFEENLGLKATMTKNGKFEQCLRVALDIVGENIVDLAPLVIEAIETRGIATIKETPYE